MRFPILLLLPLIAPAQLSAFAQTDKADHGLPAGVARITGTDDGSKIAYALITIEGKFTGLAQSGSQPSPQPMSPPRLTAQCSQTAAGKQKFELQMDFGGAAPATPLAFYPPWHATKDDLYPPSLPGVIVTMEFLGYTKAKPVNRTWRYTREQPDQLRYAAPGLQSGNMEEIMYYLQYLRALPTLRLSVRGKPAVVFETQQWQNAVRAEPLCHASGL